MSFFFCSYDIVCLFVIYFAVYDMAKEMNDEEMIVSLNRKIHSCI